MNVVSGRRSVGRTGSGYWRCLLCLACAVAIVPIASAGTVDILIHQDQPLGAVEPRVFGSNLPTWLGDRLKNSRFRARAAASGIRDLRIPGGSLSDDYGWLSCEMRADQPKAYPCSNGWASWAARPSDFIDFADAVGARLTYTVNINVTPQEAAAAVAFFNAKPGDATPIGVDRNGFDWKTAGHWAQLRADHGHADPVGIRVWEIGNEIYGAKPATAGAGCLPWGWENAWTCDGTEYVLGARGHAGFRAIRRAMRAIDPGILVGAVGFEDPANDQGWDRGVLTAGGREMDFLVVHPYAYFDPPPADSNGYAEMLAKPRALWPKIAADLHGAFAMYANGRSKPLAATEYNLVSVQDRDNSRLMTRAVNGLFVAETIGQALAQGFWSANQWDLANGCAGNGSCYDLLQVDHDYRRAPQYYAFPLWAKFGRSLLAVDSSLDPVSRLSVYAGRAGDKVLTVLAINKTGEPIDGVIRLDGAVRIVRGTASVASATSLDSEVMRFNGVDDPADDLSDAPPKPLSRVGATVRYRFAPYSISLLRLQTR